MTPTAPTLTDIRRNLAVHRPVILPVDRPHAAVALLLIDAHPVPEALFILRSRHERDPWSGDIGFPGGRVAKGETDPRLTAERESAEELAIDLTATDYLGRLDDLYGATLPILVSCFVYAHADRPVLTPNHEVETTFWIPLDRLLDQRRHRLENFTYRGHPTTQPVADLLGPGEPLLWGITYRLLRSFFNLLDRPFGLDRDSPLCPPPNSR